VKTRLRTPTQSGNVGGQNIRINGAFMTGSNHQSAPSGGAGAPLRVMLVGESQIVADRVRKALESVSDITIAVTTTDGVSAVSALRRENVDAIILDIGDVEGNVKVTLARLFRIDPAAKIVMVASLSFANVKNSMLGLLEGAAEFIPTPAAHTKSSSEIEFARNLTSVIRAMGRTERVIDATPGTTPRLVELSSSRTAPKTATIVLHAASKVVPDVLVIGSSTGGPQALFTFFDTLPADVQLPILITQHMPATFTTLLAGHITKHSGRDCREGENGEPVVPNRVYLAPGDRHMSLHPAAAGATIRLTDDPPVNFCRPSVDPLFFSAAKIYGAKVIAVMLTGMGSDGLDGARAVVTAGGNLIAQNEETCVVWGMPRAVAEAGICAAVLPLPQLGPCVGRALRAQW